MARSFFEIIRKFNRWHDPKSGRFTSGHGGAVGGSSYEFKPIKPNPKWAYQPDEETDISDMVENPIPFVGVGTDMDLAVKFEDETIQQKYISNTKVNISELKTLQPFVLRSGIENYKHWDDSDRPYVVDFEGQKYVIDGNHRIARAKIKGEKTVNVDISVRELRVSKTFDEIIRKFNKWHDPSNGRFTSGPGGGASAWSVGLGEEKQKVLQMKPNEQALYVLDHDGDTYDNCVAAMKNGTTEALVNNYFAIMSANGDPTPTKQTSDQLTYKLKDDVDGGKYDGYQEAREDYIQNMAGQSQGEAKASMNEFQKWFGGSWDSADTSVLDKYIESDHVYDGKIYRGMKFDDSDYDTFMKNISPGAQISMRRNSSWSSNEDVARNFGAHAYDDVNTVMVTCVKNRTSAPVAHLSTQGEEEVLAHSKAKWTVLHSETTVWPSGARKTYLTVVEAGE